ASELRDVREDSDTNRRAPATRDRGANITQPYDPEATASLDLRRVETMIARNTQLEQQVQRLEHDEAASRKQLAEAEGRLRDAVDRDAALRKQLAETETRLRDALARADDDVDTTKPESKLPSSLSEHLSVLEESIDSLRANMRAASDETAMMEQTES